MIKFNKNSIIKNIIEKKNHKKLKGQNNQERELEIDKTKPLVPLITCLFCMGLSHSPFFSLTYIGRVDH